MCGGCVCTMSCNIVVIKQVTAYGVRISDWSSDVCSSDLIWNRMVQALCAEQRAENIEQLFYDVKKRTIVLLWFSRGSPTIDCQSAEKWGFHGFDVHACGAGKVRCSDRIG